jgi:hypothetical protein
MRRPFQAPTRSPLTQRLGFRLAALLAVALLPLGVISLLQAGAWLDAAREQKAAALAGETLRVSAPITGLIREAQGSAEALALTVAPFVGDDAACDAVMSRVKADSGGTYSIRLLCSHRRADDLCLGRRHLRLRRHPALRGDRGGHAPGRVRQEQGPVSGTSVILIVEPVADPAGAGRLGYVAVAIPQAALSGPQAVDPDHIDPSSSHLQRGGDGAHLLEEPLRRARPAAGVPLADLADRAGWTSFAAPPRKARSASTPWSR